MTWHLLDVISASQKEFAAALSDHRPVVNWAPRFSFSAFAQDREQIVNSENPALQLREFPQQRGYHLNLLSKLTRSNDRLLQRLLRHSKKPDSSPLVCTSPFYAEVAERWPGPVIYYQTDFVAAYDGLNPTVVRELDQRLCHKASLVCPNSHRLRDYFVDEAQCAPEKIDVIPNATRTANVQQSPTTEAAALPADIAALPRPIAGVIGNMAANLDWCLLEDAIQQSPWISWVFVGPTSMNIAEQPQRESRERLMRASGGQVRFVGNKPYGELQSYARAFDVAVLPYRRKEPTFSGSPTRLFEHLAACRPMVGTRGVAELSFYEPLLQLVDTADQMSAAFNELRANQFHDGYEAVRWHASQRATWENRAARMVDSLEQRRQPAAPIKYRTAVSTKLSLVRAA